MQRDRGNKNNDYLFFISQFPSQNDNNIIINLLIDLQTVPRKPFGSADVYRGIDKKCIQCHIQLIEHFSRDGLYIDRVFQKQQNLTKSKTSWSTVTKRNTEVLR